MRAQLMLALGEAESADLNEGHVVYPRRMGRSGMKRKGRKHLPKAGTRPANEQLLHHERAGAFHPLSSDPSRRGGAGYGIIAVVVAVVAVIGIVALIVFT